MNKNAIWHWQDLHILHANYTCLDFNFIPEAVMAIMAINYQYELWMDMSYILYINT